MVFRDGSQYCCHVTGTSVVLLSQEGMISYLRSVQPNPALAAG